MTIDWVKLIEEEIIKREIHKLDMLVVNNILNLSEEEEEGI